MNKKFVLTGGPGVGKTSIINSLRKQNYDVRDEVFTDLFRKAQREGRFSDEFLHSPALVHDLLRVQVELERQPCPGSFQFLDRSRVDILGFSKNMGIVPFVEDQNDLLQGDYDLVFVISPMPKNYYVQNEVRRQTYEESLEHHASVVQHYREYILGQQKTLKDCLIEVPFYEGDFLASVQWRTEFILREVSEYLGSSS